MWPDLYRYCNSQIKSKFTSGPGVMLEAILSIQNRLFAKTITIDNVSPVLKKNIIFFFFFLRQQYGIMGLTYAETLPRTRFQTDVISCEIKTLRLQYPGVITNILNKN